MTERHAHTICLAKNNSWHQHEFQSGPSWYILISFGLVVVYLVSQHGYGPGACTAWSVRSDRKTIMTRWCDEAWREVRLLFPPWNGFLLLILPIVTFISNTSYIYSFIATANVSATSLSLFHLKVKFPLPKFLCSENVCIVKIFLTQLYRWTSGSSDTEASIQKMSLLFTFQQL